LLTSSAAAIAREYGSRPIASNAASSRLGSVLIA
jgi:hypothetical protein